MVDTTTKLCREGCNRPCAPHYLVCQRCRHGPSVPCPTCDGLKRPESKRCIKCFHTKPELGPKHGAWKGGRVQLKDGYVKVYASDDPRANMGRYMLEHILIMEDKLGRQLLPGETVHHKNTIRNDNRPENLELRLKSKHPAGGSAQDMLSWAHEIIEQYEDLNI